jgi:ribonuclease VapC
MTTYILDASAVIALYKEEEGKDKVRGILKEAENGTASVYMSVVNLAEVHSRFIRLLDMEQALVILDQIYDLPLQIINTINRQVFDEASRLKGTYHMSLADSFGLATACDLSGSFVTSDGELKEPEAAEHAPVYWFRPPKEKQAQTPRRTMKEAERELAEAKHRIAELEAR